MAATATRAIKARTETSARFDVARNRMHFLECESSVGEVLGVDTHHGRSRFGLALTHARVNGANRLFRPCAYAGRDTQCTQACGLTQTTQPHRIPSVLTAFAVRCSPLSDKIHPMK